MEGRKGRRGEDEKEVRKECEREKIRVQENTRRTIDNVRNGYLKEDEKISEN